MEVQQLITARVAMIDTQVDHYTLLGVAPGAPAEHIRKTYFALARQLHPDRLASLGIADDNHVAHKVFAQLNTAFSVLSDHERRLDYDDLLGRGGESAASAEQLQAEEIAQRIFQSEEAYKRSELALKRGDLVAAINEVTHAIQLNPNEPDFSALHAWAMFCAAPDKNAVAHQTRTMLSRAIDQSPRAINARFFLGRVERMLGRDQVALDLFKQVLTTKPHHFEAQSEVRAIEARLHPKGGGGGLFGRKR
jgi:tetratricopeptide (TPR) repeat protein